MSFEIQPETNSSARLIGRLDAAQADSALAVLNELSGPLTLDCTGLAYISSAGLSVLLVTYRRLQAQGEILRLVNLQPNVRNVISYSGLHRLFKIE